jgi:hypothetical protein
MFHRGARAPSTTTNDRKAGADESKRSGGRANPRRAPIPLAVCWLLRGTGVTLTPSAGLRRHSFRLRRVDTPKRTSLDTQRVTHKRTLRVPPSLCGSPVLDRRPIWDG